jgi:A/G-specific adenine glycosylase
MKNLAQDIADWYQKNARDLPWRKTSDPYKIWVSEIMLQQTQVSRVIEYYTRFLGKFPKVEDLAQVEWEEMLPYWRGLGFYSRGKNMLKTAKIVTEKYNGVFPNDKKELQKLPGIGPYTAAAILSFAYKKAVPALDTNLLRVFQRYFGCTEKGVEPRANALFLADKTHAEILNHALMDLGSSICMGRKVLCEECPLQKKCHFANSGQREKWEQSLLQTKAGKIIKSKKIPMEVAVACIHKDGKYLICKRPVEKGGAWEFPGGKREKGEDWRHCLKREIMEELGVEISARPHFFEEVWEEGDYFWRLRFARCQILHGEITLHEHTEKKWISAKELSTLTHFPKANRNAVQQLKKFRCC